MTQHWLFVVHLLPSYYEYYESMICRVLTLPHVAHSHDLCLAKEGDWATAKLLSQRPAGTSPHVTA